MMQFTVPQFIEVEDKIFGPITVRQFIILLVDGIILAICWKFTDLTLFIILLVILGGGGLVTAFLKVNGQPFHYFLLNFLQTLQKPTLRVWHKFYSDQELRHLAQMEKEAPPPPKPYKEPVSISRLSEMTLVVDTGGKYTPEE
ncbi:MAG: hypothetical protein UT86_C0002G0077 [Candidatus Magasanikbacteria bacterium GW2011_GWC2_40_17]|uniref:PrgI family protein n=1 Tax=Candidatus Magasanikbacteria bacterium GW2011_GWA2_42_32 TaxID=1619039 RepID=A0A0G1D5D1_9BACT|nr:MAG: hypothetical protein UT86_C0002G0077 [Candidatus Magasanikbacteria bacterium GW2011_GWC2_40_17]KKS57238.1 MAG: hypothetical protein UV20_C0002G0027 [Candidatus Magasanikbacteria bacterium GW2011_GWA2_42_32]OGH86130.1 MAG: hypothetical protein A2294_02640 [Candidatus Magasanikbacteria bacterium RIFOXYB2_FULL_38_10]